MDKTRTNTLWGEYPFTRSSGDPRRDLMCFGFECADGWFPILTRLFDKFKAMNLSETFRIIQVKEKFGGLRVYVEGGTDEVFDTIDAAEAESFKTCEYCGKPGKLRGDMSWIKTLCDDCYETNEERKLERWTKANERVLERYEMEKRNRQKD